LDFRRPQTVRFHSKTLDCFLQSSQSKRCYQHRTNRSRGKRREKVHENCHGPMCVSVVCPFFCWLQGTYGSRYETKPCVQRRSPAQSIEPMSLEKPMARTPAFPMTVSVLLAHIALYNWFSHRGVMSLGQTNIWVDLCRLIRATRNSSSTASADASAGDQMYLDFFKVGLQKLSLRLVQLVIS
jgi:hypothetical protein